MRRRLGSCWNQTPRVDAAVRLLALLVPALSAALSPPRAHAQGAPGVQLSVERCAGAPFDVDAYAKALEVELKVLNAASLVPGSSPDGASGPQLVVALPGCGDALQVTLRVREREASEGLRASDFAGVGQPRALALATIEALRVLSLRVQAPQPAEPSGTAPDASTAPPEAAAGDDRDVDAPAPEGDATAEPNDAATDESAKATDAEPPPPALSGEPPRRSARSRQSGPPPWLALHMRAGLGAWGAPDAHVHAGAALALSPSVWVKAELGYGQALDRTALGALRAHQALAGALLELHLRPFAPLELWLASGLRGGLTVVSAEIELALAPGLRARDALAPVLYAPLELGVLLDSGVGFVIGAFVEPGLWLVGARFAGPTATNFDMAARDAHSPLIELLGASLQAGLSLGYRF